MSRLLIILTMLAVSNVAVAQTVPDLGTKEADQLTGLTAPPVLLTQPKAKSPVILPAPVLPDHSWEEGNAIKALYVGLSLTLISGISGGVYSGYATESRAAGLFVGSFGAMTGLLTTLLFSTHVGHKSHLRWASGMTLALSLVTPFLLGFSLQ